MAESATILVFGYVGKLAQLLSGVQQTLNCSNNHTCVFLTFCLTLHHCLSFKSSDCCSTCQIHQSHDSLCIWHLVLDLSVPDWFWVVFACLVICLVVSLMAQFSAVHVFSAVYLWQCLTGSQIISMAISVNLIVPFITVTTWITSHSWGVSSSPWLWAEVCPAVFWECLPEYFLW